MVQPMFQKAYFDYDEQGDVTGIYVRFIDIAHDYADDEDE